MSTLGTVFVAVVIYALFGALGEQAGKAAAEKHFRERQHQQKQREHRLNYELSPGAKAIHEEAQKLIEESRRTRLGHE